jgi:hypothetical protein
LLGYLDEVVGQLLDVHAAPKGIARERAILEKIAKAFEERSGRFFLSFRSELSTPPTNGLTLTVVAVR